MVLSPQSDQAIHFLWLCTATLKRWVTLDNHIKSRAGQEPLFSSGLGTHKLISSCLCNITDINPEGDIYMYTPGWHLMCAIFQAVQIIEWMERKMTFVTQMQSLIHGNDINWWQTARWGTDTWPFCLTRGWHMRSYHPEDCDFYHPVNNDILYTQSHIGFRQESSQVFLLLSFVFSSKYHCNSFALHSLKRISILIHTLKKLPDPQLQSVSS